MSKRFPFAGRCAASAVLSMMASAPSLAQLALPPLLDAPSTVAVGCSWHEDMETQNQDTGFRDSHAVYFTAMLPVDPGPDTYYEIEGRFPKARYFSLQTYDGARIGNFIDSLPDAWIHPLGIDAALPSDPAVLPDSGDYTYRYRVRLVYDNPPASEAQRQPNTVYARRGTYSGALVKQLGLRIYLPNPGATPLGDIGLPTITYVGPRGRIDLRNTPDQQTCANGKTLAAASNGTLGASAGRARPSFRALDGSLVVYPNGDAYYLQADVGRDFSDMLVVRGKAPVIPLLPPLSEPDPDVRYWSACQYDLRSSDIVACVADRNVVLQADGHYTVVVSTTAKRPPAAVAASGYNWLPWGSGSDGRFALRQVLPSPDFAGHYAQARAAPFQPLEQTLGEWAPEISYCDRQTFDATAAQGGAALMAACKAAYRPPSLLGPLGS